MRGCLDRLVSIVLFIAIFFSFGLAANRGPEGVDTSDFDSIRSSVEPYVEEWFEQARESSQAFYNIDRETVQEVSSEDAYIKRIWASCREDESGTIYCVLFIVTMSARGYQQGYIYSPSGRIPSWDGLHTEGMDESWFVFTDTS